MKSGVEQRGKLIFAIVLGVIALFAFWTAMRSRPTVAGAAAPAAPSAQPSPPRGAPRQKRRGGGRTLPRGVFGGGAGPSASHADA